MSAEKPPVAPAAVSQRDREIEVAVELLLEQQRLREAIQVVERWRASGSPTPTAERLQARCLFEIRAMDPALRRLDTALAANAKDGRALKLLVELLVERGWKRRATEALDRLQETEDDGDFSELQALVESTQRGLPQNAKEIEATSSFDERLALARKMLGTGSFVRARALLEKLEGEAPENTHVKTLLWGLVGSFDPGQGSPENLVPDIFDLVSEMDLTRPSTESSNTGEEDAEPSAEQLGESFPSLFRRVDETDQMGLNATNEITQSTPIQFEGEVTNDLPLVDPSVSDVESTSSVEGVKGDTQIMNVIANERGATLAPAEGQSHRAKALDEDDYDLAASLDLKAYRSHMGVEDLPGFSPIDADMPDATLAGLEDEDDDIVVITRREEVTESSDILNEKTDSIKTVSRIRVIDNVPSPGQPSLSRLARIPLPTRPDSVQAAEAKLDRFEFDIEAGETPPDPEANATRPKRIPLYVFLILVLSAGLWALDRHNQTERSAEELRARVNKAIAADDYKILLQQEAQLEKAMQGEEGDDPALLAALSRVETLLWTEYAGDPSRLTRAANLSSLARESAPDRTDTLLAAAELALSENRLDNAQTMLDLITEHTAESHIAEAGLAMHRENARGALLSIRKATNIDPLNLRALRLTAEISFAAEDLDGAAVALRTAMSLGEMNQRLFLSKTLSSIARRPLAEQVDDLSNLIERMNEDSLAPRLKSSLHLQRSTTLHLLGRQDEARKETQLAIADDASDPRALARMAVFMLAENDPESAVDDLARAARYRPGDIAIRTLLVRALLALDRIDEALEQIEEAKRAHPSDERLPVMEAWAAIIGAADVERGRPLIEPFVEAHPDDAEARYLLGVCLAMVNNHGALDELDLAASMLKEAGDPSLPLLADRATAWKLRVMKDAYDVQLYDALNARSKDPLTHTILGQHFEAIDDFQRAEKHYKTAIKVGGNMAIPHWFLGFFYLDQPSRRAQTHSSWARYLEFSPSGKRAKRAKSQLGR